MEIPSNEVLLAELKANKVLKTLSEKEFAALAKSVRFIPYKKGETIFKQGNRVNDISILMRGLTKTCIENRSHERNTIVSLQLPIDLLGYSTVFDETYQATAVALCDSIVAVFEQNLAQQFSLSNSKFASAMLETLCKKTNVFMKQIADLGQKQIKARMATIILIIADLIKSDFIDINISRNELAEYAGISTGSAIRLLSDLEKEGLIVLDKKTIDIKNRQGLEAVSMVD
jgi:CRP/FNR family transcriptional regulator